MSSQVPRRGKVRVLAVAGPNDHQNTAAPDRDGWFLSDFFFLQHIFKDLAAPEDQLWLTCLDPRSLVNKYGVYTHGNPREDHRKIVLNKDLMAKAYDAVTIVHADTLRDTYLKILAEWTHAAAQTGQRIFTILLCHGYEIQRGGATHVRFVIGGNHDQGNPTMTNRLDLERLVLSIASDSEVSILTSACHSGAWLQYPKMPNISMLAAVPPKYDCHSWPLSTNSQTCGGRYVSGIVETLLRINIPGITLIDGNEDQPDQGAIAWEGPSYAALTSAVHDVMKNYDPSQGVYPTTSARSDYWDAHGMQLYGIRPEQIQARIDQLRSVPRSTNMLSGTSATASFTSLEVGAMDHRVEYEVGHSFAKKLAHQYLSSFPGLSSLVGNIVIGNQCRRLLQRGDVSPDEIQRMLHTLQYRLKDVMLTATKYKEYLNARFPDCEQWDQHGWEERVKDLPNKERLWNIYRSAAFHKIKRANLFLQPNDCRHYGKGEWYLAAVLAERGADSRAIDIAVQLWETLRDEKGQIAMSIRKLELSRQRKVRNALQMVGNRVSKRVREVSPRKQAHRNTIG